LVRKPFSYKQELEKRIKKPQDIIGSTEEGIDGRLELCERA
jgi:hypothetical protein